VNTTPKRYSVKTGSRESIQNTRDAIRACEPFKTSGSFYGSKSLDTGWGRLATDAKDRFITDRAEIDYVVVSYSTPIAWHTPTGWVLVEQKFSPTTGSHQSTLLAALNGRRASGPLWQEDPINFHTVGGPQTRASNVDQQDCPSCEWTGQVRREALDGRDTENGYEWTCPKCWGTHEWEGEEL
jgi:hypothetical protein